MTRYGDCLRRACRVIVSLHEHDGWLARCYSSGTHLDDIEIEDVDDDAPADEALEEAKRMFPDAIVFLDDGDE